jgi:hydroxyacylglutathione hydrolase
LDIAIESKQQVPPLDQQPRRVHTITDRFAMANTYLIQEERFVIVDPDSALNVRLLVEYLQYFLHRSPSDIDLIVLTHLHSDHSVAIEALRQVCNAPVAASAEVRHLAQAQQSGNRTIPGALYGVFHSFDFFPPEYSRQIQMIDIWLEDVEGLPDHLDWRIITSPGHRPESLCLYNPFTRELLCGDAVVRLEDGVQLAGERSNRRQLEETLQTLRHLDVYYLYPSHGRAILSKNAITNLRVNW